jgi:hypothetical protein
MTKAQKLSKKMSKLGQKGGKATVRKKGKKFFSKISLMRRHCRGGRKPKVKPKVQPNVRTTELNLATLDD